MSEDEKQAESTEISERKSAQQKALKVPTDALIDHLNRIAPESKCSFCGTGEYGVVPAPSGQTAGVVSVSVPRVQNLGVWFFFATCNSCGHTIFFNAPHIMKMMSEEH